PAITRGRSHQPERAVLGDSIPVRRVTYGAAREKASLGEPPGHLSLSCAPVIASPTRRGEEFRYHPAMTARPCPAASARRAFLLGALALALAPAGRAAEVNATSGVAIDGYDPVAYFTAGRPMRGSRRV